MIAHWPAGISGAIRGRLVSQLASLQDIMATVVDLSGGEYPAELPPCLGKSISPLLAGVDRPIHTEPLFWEHEGNAAVRDGKWKLVREYEKPWELYDLDVDRTELNDLSSVEPERTGVMISLWETWATNNAVEFPKRFNMYEFVRKKNRP